MPGGCKERPQSGGEHSRSGRRRGPGAREEGAGVPVNYLYRDNRELGRDGTGAGGRRRQRTGYRGV
jgi:hypothetical protein